MIGAKEKVVMLSPGRLPFLGMEYVKRVYM
jgi:hypothetical protein